MKRSPLIILALTLFIDLLGFGLILPLLPVYITHYGGKPWVGGALLASFSVAQFIFAPIWGRMSDRYGRRPLILLSLVGSATSFLAFGLAPNLAVLFIARVFAGILSAASLPTAQAYIADVTTPEKRAGGMAVLGAAFGLGFAIGPAIGGVMSRFSVFGQPALATPAFFAALLCLINFISAYFLLPESNHDRTPKETIEKGLSDLLPSIWRSMRHPQVGAQLTVFAFTTFAFTAVESSFSWLILLRFRETLAATAIRNYEAAHLGQSFLTLAPLAQKDLLEKAQAGASTLVFIIVGVTILITQVAVMGGLARKVGENRLVVFGSGLLTLTLVGLAFAPTLPIIWVLSACIAIGNGVLNPSLSALITQAAGPRERGALSGTQQGLGSLARIIAPPINNTIVAFHPGPLLVGSLPFLGSSALMGVAFLLSLGLKPLTKTDSSTDPKQYPIAAGEQLPTGEQDIAVNVSSAGDLSDRTHTNGATPHTPQPIDSPSELGRK